MDTHFTSGEVARGLGTSIPRVHRAVAAGIVKATRDDGGRLGFRRTALQTLRRRWGWCPLIDGLSREEIFALAALARRPLGFRSARAMARATGLSPTTASKALNTLRSRRLVECRTVRTVEGRARDVEIWTVRWGSQPWLRVASDIGRCELPERRPATAAGVPPRLAHVFWNVDLRALDVVRDARFIADRILRDGDAQAMAWLAGSISSRAIADAATGRGLDPRRRALARVLAT